MTVEVVICGAGIAGIAAAYELAVRRGMRGVALVDERPPLSLTSDKSTEAYRNWWPGPDGAMVALMNRSIDRLEALARASGNVFRLNRRGYVYATAEPERVTLFRQAAEQAAAQGAGPVRVDDYTPHHAEGLESDLTGADLLLDPALIRQHFPYLSERTAAVVHARRCGWFSSTEFGAYLLEEARRVGVTLINAPVAGVEVVNGAVRGVRLGDGQTLATGSFVNAGGPLANEVARLLGLEVPLFCERHAKLAFHDDQGVIPRDAPMLIWADPQRLPWEAEEREMLAEDEATRGLLAELPGGAHLRPEGGSGSDVVLMLWAYDAHPVPPVWPVNFDPSFPEVVLRGLSTMAPGLAAYFGAARRPMLDGGYYVKTRDNRPLIGPLPVAGAYVVGGYSGYGLMAAAGGAELLADYLIGEAPPKFAAAFAPGRFEDPTYRARLAAWGDTGQL
ncbi:MAG: FAD-binding oxidoreductase [Anaerolineales bacterium]|nr:FAD-binding oxidoreductase [Anaerolineales bacterium]